MEKFKHKKLDNTLIGCKFCKEKSIIINIFRNEIICSKCGLVVSEDVTKFLGHNFYSPNFSNSVYS